MTVKRTNHQEKKRVSLAARYRGLDTCDLCGAPLQPGDVLAGLCRKHVLKRIRP